jgi:hypothetical protein
VEPRIVNWYIVTKCKNEEEKRLNETYIMNVERNLGCSFSLLLEDIFEVNPKMILIFIARIMLWSLTKQTSEDARILGNENGSVSSSFSNLVVDDNTSEACLPLDNGSEFILQWQDMWKYWFHILGFRANSPIIASNFKITICIHAEGEW